VASSGGISGTAVAVATLGAVLVYAGFRGVSPLQALRDAAGGKPPPVQGNPVNPITPVIPSNADVNTARGVKIVANAQKYAGDIYSQAKRRQPGFSDCSSFVDKALRDSGIEPPFDPWANTANYRISPEWKTIPADQALPGDIAVGPGHMVLVTAAGGTGAIGQQRTGVNVKTGTVAALFGSQSYVYKTWVGSRKR
jgi:hypothetical protein